MLTLREKFAADKKREAEGVFRTSDEKRMSNFLIWESAYAELWFSEKYWPDFGPADLALAVESYGARERRYGGAT